MGNLEGRCGASAAVFPHPQNIETILGDEGGEAFVAHSSRTRDELETIIERGLKTFIEVGSALLEIRERRLYKPAFSNFEEYCRERWGWSKTHANRQIAAAQVAQTLTPRGVTLPSEKHARPLAQLDADRQIEVVDAIHAAGTTFEDITASHVREIVEEVKSGTPASLAVHFSSESTEWYTPPEIIERVVEVFGVIDLDPCSNSHQKPVVPAASHYVLADDGLTLPWEGRVYMNPPYGDVIGSWIRKLIDEFHSGRLIEAVALIPARTDTEWFHSLWAYGAICFIRGRLKFSGSKNSAPFPSAVVYLGANIGGFQRAFSPLGTIARESQETIRAGVAA